MGSSSGTLDLELDLLAVRLADVQQELLVGGEELPVEEVVELATVDGQELGPRFQPQFLPDRSGLHRLNSNHGGEDGVLLA